MKNPFLVPLAILAVVFVALSALNFKSDYSAEKALWKINNEFSKLVSDPKAAPQASFEEVIKKYEKFIDTYKDARVAPLGHILIGRVYMSMDQFDKARAKYNEVMAKYPDEANIKITAYMDIAVSYAQEGNVLAQVDTYQKLIDEYPSSAQGLRAPLLIAQAYMNSKNVNLAKKAFYDAIEHYKKVVDQHPNSAIAFSALSGLGTCYLALNEWEAAVKVYGQALVDFPDPRFVNLRRADNIVNSINTLSIAKLRNFQLPIEIYETFIARHPKHPFNETFQTLISNLRELEAERINQNVEEPSDNAQTKQ